VKTASLQGEWPRSSRVSGGSSISFAILPYRGCRLLFSMSACIGQHFPERPGKGRPLNRNLEVVASGKYFRRLPPAEAALLLPHLPPFQGNRILNQHINAHPQHPSSLHPLHLTLFIPQRMCPLTGGRDEGSEMAFASVVTISGPKKVSIFNAHLPMAIVMDIARIKIVKLSIRAFTSWGICTVFLHDN
jgi:hypothetical protein